VRDQRLWRLDNTDLPALVEPIAANGVNTERIVAGLVFLGGSRGPTGNLLRLGASIHEGIVLPSSILTKLQAFGSPRRPGRGAADRNTAQLVKTLFMLRHPQRFELRKRVGGKAQRGRALS
jgi:hypothetical protein